MAYFTPVLRSFFLFIFVMPLHLVAFSVYFDFQSLEIELIRYMQPLTVEPIVALPDYGVEASKEASVVNNPEDILQYIADQAEGAYDAGDHAAVVQLLVQALGAALERPIEMPEAPGLGVLYELVNEMQERDVGALPFEVQQPVYEMWAMTLLHALDQGAAAGVERFQAAAIMAGQVVVRDVLVSSDWERRILEAINGVLVDVDMPVMFRYALMHVLEHCLLTDLPTTAERALAFIGLRNMLLTGPDVAIAQSIQRAYVNALYLGRLSDEQRDWYNEWYSQ